MMEKIVDYFSGKKLLKKNAAKDYAGRYIDTSTKIKLIDNSIASPLDPDLVKDVMRPEVLHLPIKQSRLVNVYYCENGKSVSGFSAYPDLAVPCLRTSSKILVRSVEDAIALGYEEDLTYGVVKQKGMVLSNVLDKPKYIRRNHTKFDMDIRSRIKYGAYSPTNIISEGKSYSFGCELETCAGVVPNYISNNLNMDCQYDGSIRDDKGNKDQGGEYTTGVLRGDAGFKQLFQICNELSKRCKINNSCSVHVHLGDISFNKETVVLMYKLFQLIEDEMYSLVPPRRRTVGYCNPMKPININLAKRGIPYDVLIDKYYDQIVTLVSLGKKPSKAINKAVNHPAGRYCNYDRNTPRYWWCNFVPVLFNLKGVGNYTIEFRNHPITLDYIKIRNWVLLCMGIMSFVENNKREIVEAKAMSIFDVIKASYPGKGKYLTDYFKERQRLFATVANAEQEEFARRPHLNYEGISGFSKLVKL